MNVITVKTRCHNPYFNRWFSAISDWWSFQLSVKRHNPYFNRWFSAISWFRNCSIKIEDVTILILIDGFLQYLYGADYQVGADVTILILIDGFLQLIKLSNQLKDRWCHNPYFNRWFSAIENRDYSLWTRKVTILILIDGFLQWSIWENRASNELVTILILIDGFLQCD